MVYPPTGSTAKDNEHPRLCPFGAWHHLPATLRFLPGLHSGICSVCLHWHYVLYGCLTARKVKKRLKLQSHELLYTLRFWSGYNLILDPIRLNVQRCCEGMQFVVTPAGWQIIVITMKKALRETQTLRTGCSKAEPKKFRPAGDPSRGRRGRCVCARVWCLAVNERG